MKKVRFAVIIVVAVLCQSCMVSQVPLTGNYKVPVFTTDMPREQVWTKLINIFATNGYAIQTIDKSSGLLVAAKQKIMKTTTENDAGLLKDSTAHVVTEKYADMNGDYNRPYFAEAGWNVVVGNENEKTTVSVNVVNIYAYVVTMSGYGSYGGPQRKETPVNAVSTGVFEKRIFEALTRK